MADLNDETVRELNERIRELTDVMQSAMGITGSSISSQKAFAKSNAEAAGSAATLNTSNKEVAKSAKDVSGANKLMAEASYKVGQSFGKLWEATTQSKDALFSFGKTMMDTREGMAKYSQAVNQAADALGTGLSAFGPIGKVLGLLLKPLTILVEQVFLFQDNLFAAKDELAKFGAVGKLTTSDIQKLGIASGYSTGEIEKYAKMVTKAGSGLVALGGSVSQGVVEFAKLTNITQQEKDRLLSLGVTMDDFVENTADFVKLQTASGKMITDQMRREGAMQRAAKEYTDNLLVLAALSGESVQEQKQKQLQLVRERESQIADMQTTMKIKQLEKGTSEDRAEASRLQKKMDLERATINLTQATLGMDAAKSLQHFLKTGVITPETMKIMRGTGMSLEELRVALSQGKDVGAKFVDSLIKGDMRLIETQGLALQLSKEFADGMGMNSERLEKLAMLQGKSVEEVKKQIEDDVKNKKLMADQAEKNRADTLKAEKKMRESVDDIAQQFQKVIPKINELVTKISDIAANIGKLNFEKLMADVKKGFEEFMGYLKIAGIGLASIVGIKAVSSLTAPGGAPGAPGAPGGKGGGRGRAAGILGLMGLGAATGAATDDSSFWGSVMSSALTMGGTGLVAGPKGAVLGAVLGALYGGASHLTQGSGQKSIPDVSGTITNINDLFNFGSGTGSKENFEKLDPKFKNALINAAKDYNSATGDKLRINSAHRNEEENKNVGGVPNSRHLQGKAVDIQQHTDPRVDEIMARHGLKSRKNDHHYEMPGARLGGSFAGPNSGYPVMLHGMETVVPTPNPNTTLLKVEGDSAAEKITNALSGMNSDALQSIMEQLYQMMDDKLSAMVDKLSTSNDLQDKLLKVQM